MSQVEKKTGSSRPSVGAKRLSEEEILINFSTAIRRLIEDSELENGEIKKELEALKRQVETLRTTGGHRQDQHRSGQRRQDHHRPDPPEEAATEETAEGIKQEKPVAVAVDPGFLRNFNFS